jgi:hypothetical protein
MMKSSNRITPKVILLASLGLMMAGCATTTPLDPGAENVKVMNNVLPASSQCSYVGQVIAQSPTGPNPPAPTSISQNEINAMKNAALKLNANVIVIKPSGLMNVQVNQTSAHGIVADAYSCMGNM